MFGTLASIASQAGHMFQEERGGVVEMNWMVLFLRVFQSRRLRLRLSGLLLLLLLRRLPLRRSGDLLRLLLRLLLLLLLRLLLRLLLLLWLRLFDNDFERLRSCCLGCPGERLRDLDRDPDRELEADLDLDLDLDRERECDRDRERERERDRERDFEREIDRPRSPRAAASSASLSCSSSISTSSNALILGFNSPVSSRTYLFVRRGKTTSHTRSSRSNSSMNSSIWIIE